MNDFQCSTGRGEGVVVAVGGHTAKSEVRPGEVKGPSLAREDDPESGAYLLKQMRYATLFMPTGLNAMMDPDADFGEFIRMVIEGKFWPRKDDLLAIHKHLLEIRRRKSAQLDRMMKFPENINRETQEYQDFVKENRSIWAVVVALDKTIGQVWGQEFEHFIHEYYADHDVEDDDEDRLIAAFEREHLDVTQHAIAIGLNPELLGTEELELQILLASAPPPRASS